MTITGNKPPPVDIPKYRRKPYGNDVVDEANLVLSEVEKANHAVDKTPNKFHSLPTRKKKKTQKPVARSSSDATPKKPLLKKLFSRKSDSNINKVGKIERDPRFEDGGARRLIRSKSDASSNRNVKDKVMKKRSETIGNSVNQLSPIIENTLKEDYFEDVANKESRWKSDDDLEEYPSDYFQKHSVDRMHSSQLPAEKPALTKGMKVDNIVKRLSMERVNTPPQSLGPTFSYIFPNNSFPEDDRRASEPRSNGYNHHSNNNNYSIENKNRENKYSPENNTRYLPRSNTKERTSLSPRRLHHSENIYSPENNYRFSMENKNRERSTVSPWRQISGPNDDVDSSKYSSRETSYSPPKNILKEQNYNGTTMNSNHSGSRKELDSLSERRRNLQNRIYTRGQSIEREMSSPPTFHYKSKTAEIKKKYSPERTHLDIIRSPSFKSPELVKRKEYDPAITHSLSKVRNPENHRSTKDYDPGSTHTLRRGQNYEDHKSTNSLRKGRKLEDTTDHKNSLRREILSDR